MRFISQFARASQTGRRAGRSGQRQGEPVIVLRYNPESLTRTLQAQTPLRRPSNAGWSSYPDGQGDHLLDSSLALLLTADARVRRRRAVGFMCGPAVTQHLFRRSSLEYSKPTRLDAKSCPAGAATEDMDRTLNMPEVHEVAEAPKFGSNRLLVGNRSRCVNPGHDRCDRSAPHTLYRAKQHAI